MTEVAESFQVSQRGSSALVVAGTLSFDTAHAALLALREGLRKGASVEELDLSAVKHSDSAGLSCVLALLAGARSHGRRLVVTHLPEGMRALARVCEVEPLLTGA